MVVKLKSEEELNKLADMRSGLWLKDFNKCVPKDRFIEVNIIVSHTQFPSYVGTWISPEGTWHIYEEVVIDHRSHIDEIDELLNY